MSKRVKRTFTACWTCRRRRIRCDGEVPHCSACKKHRVQCEGYHVELAWVDPTTGLYPSHNRRKLDFEKTWDGWPVYEDKELDHFIESHDGEDCTCKGLRPRPNPFGTMYLPQGTMVREQRAAPKLSKLLSSSSIRDAPVEDRLLFHHYVHQVAYLMIAIDGPANPWKTTYPAMALEQAASARRGSPLGLYHALLAQAAFNLANLHPTGSEISRQNQRRALEHYVKALQQTQASLDSPDTDYSSCVATLLTLIMVEGAYTAETKQWRCHLEGAMSILGRFMRHSPWLVSDDAWIVSQSLALVYEMSQTRRLEAEPPSPSVKSFLAAITSNSRFGYTVGASRDTFCCLATIRELKTRMSQGEAHDSLEDKVADIFQILCSEEGNVEVPTTPDQEDSAVANACQPKLGSKRNLRCLEALHRRMFRNATLIYFYRAMFACPPSAVQDYITNVLVDTMAFLNLECGTVSLWPVFIAAVEACSDHHREQVLRWLEYSCALGIQNRHEAKQIILATWHERDTMAERSGIASDKVAVDWRLTQQKLGFDTLML